ncbi:hypothetical protein [Lactococcus kimchii]|uniref:hypothetical protein n=1 Tax=Lactococcus sp. S-13 TaxID=2507158 RepID=UPI0010236433|nr:hypothetical protein [Lactococcus sp. S-13]RZI49771.1 hypothetical protein EQJ87_10235 [Lactococcus sp. S-13]
MKKILKFGLGLIASATVAHVAYHTYKNMEENLLRELTDTIRKHFSGRQIDAVWIFEDPKDGALFEGGIVSENLAISFDIDAKTLEIFEKNEEQLIV